MSKILFAYEFGAGLGHLNRLIAVAERLSQGHELIFAVPSKGTQAAHVHQKLGSNVQVHQGVAWSVLDLANADRVETVTLADTLRLFGFNRSDRLLLASGSWRALIRSTKPELIVSDFAPSLRLAAGGSIPIVVVGNGFTVPPPGRPLPPMRPWQTEDPSESSRSHEMEILNVANQVSKQLGGKEVSCVSDLFHGTESYVCTMPEFDPYASYRSGDTVDPFNVPKIPVGPPLQERAGPAVFVYLSTQHPRLREVLASINQIKANTQVYVSGVSPQRLARELKGHVGVHTKPADFASVLPAAKVLLHHGGLGTAYAGLAAGTAQVILPLRLEHLITARGVMNMKGGKVIERRAPPEEIVRVIRGLLTDEAQSQSARNVGHRLADMRTRDSRQAIVDTCLRLLGA